MASPLMSKREAFHVFSNAAGRDHEWRAGDVAVAQHARTLAACLAALRGVPNEDLAMEAIETVAEYGTGLRGMSEVADRVRAALLAAVEREVAK